MMTEIKTPPARPMARGTETHLDQGAVDACDYCGETVRRETAAKRMHRGENGTEVVLVCRECDSGAD